jgi:hypothetical protein
MAAKRTSRIYDQHRPHQDTSRTVCDESADTDFSRVSVEAAVWTSAGGGRAGGPAGEGRFQAGTRGVGRARPRDGWRAAPGRSHCEKANSYPSLCVPARPHRARIFVSFGCFAVNLRPMSKGRKILVVAACAVAVAGVVTFLTRSKEPSYQGRSLGEWVDRYASSEVPGVPNASHSPGGVQEANEAIQQIGTNAVPYLLALLRKGQPSSASEVIAKILPDSSKSKYRIPRAFGVPSAFAALGPKARFAVPDLVKLANDTNNIYGMDFATRALGTIGEDGVAPLLVLMTNQCEVIRAAAVFAMTTQGTNALPAVPNLVQAYREMPHPTIAKTLGTLAVQPDIVVPALTNALSDRRPRVRAFAIEALGNFAARARLATAPIIKALDDRNSDVRKAATNALLKIAPEALTNAPPK